MQTFALAALIGVLASGCARREHMAAEPTPTPGSMDMAYGVPTAQPADLMQPDNALPAPPAEATPTPQPVAEAPQPEPPTPEPTPAPLKAGRSYIVQRGDSLWDISGRPPILGDRFRWPLLFKANRDEIRDPDLIQPGQRLTWKENYSMPEIEEAIQKSKDTPKFVPHSSERKQLPIDY